MTFIYLLFITIPLILATLIYFYIIWSEERNRKEYARRNVPYVPQRNAFLQMILRERPELVKHECIEQKGKVFGFNFVNCYTILIAEPELAQLVLSKEFTNFSDRRTFETDDPIFKYNVFIVNGKQWKCLRAIITPTFSTGKLRRMKPLIDDTVRTLLKNMDAAIANDTNNVNVKQLYGAFTIDTIIQIGFGIKVDSLIDQDNPIIAHAQRLFSVDVSMKNIFTITMVFLS